MVCFNNHKRLPKRCLLLGRNALMYSRSLTHQYPTPVQFSHSACQSPRDPVDAAHQASLPVTSSQSLLTLMSTESRMPSIHLILCQPLLLPPSIFPKIRVFSNESALHIRWPSIGASVSASVLPKNSQDQFPLGWTGWISLQSKELSRVFSNTTVQKQQFFWAQLSL